MGRARVGLLSLLLLVSGALSCERATSPASENAPEAVERSSPLPALPPEAIAFDADLEKRGEMTIHVVALDDAEPSPLGTGLKAQAQPAWSPDRDEIAFSGVLRGRDEADIWVMNADGSDLRRVTKGAGNDIGPDWSPDGERIAFSRGYFHHRGKPRSDLMDVFVVDVRSGRERELTDNGAIEAAPDWSPDGTAIVFSSDRTGTSDIWSITPAGDGLRRLTADPGSHDLSPRWSPDGTRILFSRAVRATRSAIYVMDSRGSNALPLTGAGGRDFLPVWAPDGAWIAFVRGGATADIYVMESDGQRVRALTHGGGLETNPAWAS